MASKKRKRPAAANKAKMAHSDASRDHAEVEVRLTIGIIGPITRLRKRKAHQGRKATPKQAKAFLKWVLTQL